MFAYAELVRDQRYHCFGLMIVTYAGDIAHASPLSRPLSRLLSLSAFLA